MLDVRRRVPFYNVLFFVLPVLAQVTISIQEIMNAYDEGVDRWYKGGWGDDLSFSGGQEAVDERLALVFSFLVEWVVLCVRDQML